MPELPEVEIIARQLHTALKGQKIKGIQVRRKKSWAGSVKRVVGRKIIKVKRRAKIVIIVLGKDLNLLVHLKMTGQLVYQKTETRNQKLEKLDKKFKDHKPHFKAGGRIVGGHPSADWVKKLPSNHTRVVMKLTEGTLFFNDMRVFGWVRVVESRNIEEEFKNFGPDVIDGKRVTNKYFYEALQSSRRAVKLVILDQKKMAGVGNIYANDGLFCAGIDPRRPANELARLEASKLLKCLVKVLKLGIKYGGASQSDFVHTSGLGGKYQERFLVYDRKGEKCKKRGCVGEVVKIKLGGRGTYFCQKCQT